MDPATIKLLWKLAPWALILVLSLGLWGAYGYVKDASRRADTAEHERDEAVAKKDAIENKAREDQALLAARESDLSVAHQTIAAQHKRITEFQHEGCIDLDSPAPWLDQLLPARAPLQRPG